MLTAENFNAPGLEAFLVDAFTNALTPIGLTGNTTINFTVSSNTATTAANRFKIVFRNATALPVNITNIKAQQKNNDVQVQWTTVNEQNIDSYEVEKSSNAINFKKLETVLSNSTQPNNTYTVVDASVPTGTFYYRIKIVEKNGNNYYSKIVKITIGKNTNANIVNVYPNPVKGNTLQLQLMNVEQGEYVVRIINTQGQVVQQSTLQHTGGSATTSIVLSKAIAAGNYQLEMTSEKGVRIVQKMIKE